MPKARQNTATEPAVLNLSWRSKHTEVRQSPIHGLGVFARKAISKGELVAMKGGFIFDGDQWRKLEPRLGPAEIQIAESLFIGPATKQQRDGAMIYTNHSCEPNIAVQGQIAFVAMRDIDPGEELTHDWATTDDVEYEMTCQCNTPSCRGTITGKDWQRKDLQDRYRGWFCWFLQRKIDAEQTP